MVTSPDRSDTYWRHADNGLSDYIFYSRYSRFLPETGRRETFAEAVHRVEQMHRERFRSFLAERIAVVPRLTPAEPADHALLQELFGNVTLDTVVARAFAAAAARRVLPSMRTLQFGGESIRRHPARLFNCAFSPADRPAFFREFFYLLLAGCGCGFSVQREHVSRLPVLPPPRVPGAPQRHLVADSIEGWAEALDGLIDAHYAGREIKFDFARVRPRGAPIGTEGRAAPGPEPLRQALDEVAGILREAAGRRLRPIEVYDICMFVSRAVMAGGVRRSASICLFSADDEEMINAKTGAWLVDNPQRAASTNSAVILRAQADEATFRRLVDAQRIFGEPGFYFADEVEYGCNPCGEAGLHPVLAGPLAPGTVADLRRLGFTGELPSGVRLSGWQMCNLTTINGAAIHHPEQLLVAAVNAAVIGTLQAAYTDIDYLGPVTRHLNERDALLGVSICGFMDHPAILLSRRLLERAARLARAANELVAHAIGIRPAARVTCVKPEGTAALLLGTAAGIHPHPAHRYFRRVCASASDPIGRQFRQRNPEMVETSSRSPAGDVRLVFPVEAPPHAEVRADGGAVAFLERVLLVQRHWVLAGEAPDPRSPGLHHNVSHTCPVHGDEWPAVADFIWHHRGEFSGVALLADEAITHYPDAPLHVVTPDDRERWNQLVCRPVDYYVPLDETTRDAGEAERCTPGACDPS